MKRACEKTKTQEILGKLSQHGLLFSNDVVIHRPPKRPTTALFPDALFLHFPLDLQTFSAEGPIPNTQKTPFWGSKSCSKGHYHALEKVLTSETPCIGNSFLSTRFSLKSCSHSGTSCNSSLRTSSSSSFSFVFSVSADPRERFPRDSSLIISLLSVAGFSVLITVSCDEDVEEAV